ncbi:alpha/beta hydrolase [Sodalis sp. dw_96]|uniref:alpha/beta fold hydrolase n=1 Tax=Sodalis sp. dw_96 TaxID=2719794 RepID=UPI001BD4DCBA|nr:alpha/beta hydrolase [Sodalis sp. dw_96]
MKYFLNGIQLNLVERGNGSPAIIFLHYWGGSSRTWRKVIAALPDSYHTIAPDLRGWGESAAPADNGFALIDFVNDILAMITALDVRKYVLVGHSMGGKIAQLLASQRPRGLAGLVLIAPAPPVPMLLTQEALLAMENAYASPESVNMAIDHMLSAKPLSSGQRQQIVEDSLRGAPGAKIAWPRYASQEDISAEAAGIVSPTVIIAGELDWVETAAVLKTALLPLIPHALLHVLPGTGHLSPLESPAEIAGIIREFIECL